MTFAMAGGALRFSAPKLSNRPKVARADAIATAREAVGNATGGAEPDCFLALFDVPTDDGLDVESRLVWVVRFRDIERERAAPLTIPPKRVVQTKRSNERESRLTTTTLAGGSVTTDVVVVVDAKTGDQLLRSAYASTQR